MSLMFGLFKRRPEPKPEDEELEEEYQRQLDWERRQVGEVHIRPLLWTTTPPSSSGWWWVRRPGNAEYIPFKVEPGYDYPTGFEWSSAKIQVPK